MSKRFLMLIPIAAITLGGSAACATKKFVRTSVGQVNEKVDSLGRSLEETQERTKQSEVKIVEVDRKVGVADEKAQAAGRSADAANAAAVEASTAANAARSKADAVDKSAKRMVFEVVLNEEQGSFKFGKSDLPDAAKARLDELVGQLKADPKGAFFEVEGYTDNVGDAAVNEKLGLQRGESVKRYLHEHHQVPLHKVNVISYGEQKPVAPNTSRAGRAQNRRVVIRVVA
jgi:peptidoglycan-associated lipoprotein